MRTSRISLHGGSGAQVPAAALSIEIFLASSIASTGAAIGKSLNQKKQLSLVFITTAAEPEPGEREWLAHDRNSLVAGGFQVTDYTITGKSGADFDRDLAAFDVIHVNGGNSFYLLLQVLKSGFNQWVIDAVSSGKIYIGSSAGAIVASPDISVTSKLESKLYQEELQIFPQKGLGLVDVLVFPHWGSDDFKELYLNRRLEMAYKPENRISLLTDYQYLKSDGESFEFHDLRVPEVSLSC